MVCRSTNASTHHIRFCCNRASLFNPAINQSPSENSLFGSRLGQGVDHVVVDRGLDGLEVIGLGGFDELGLRDIQSILLEGGQGGGAVLDGRADTGIEGAVTLGLQVLDDLVLRTYDLMDVFKLNLEGNHANLAGHTYQHEIRTAREAGVLGSLDANQGDKLIGLASKFRPP